MDIGLGKGISNASIRKQICEGRQRRAGSEFARKNCQRSKTYTLHGVRCREGIARSHFAKDSQRVPVVFIAIQQTDHGQKMSVSK